MASSSVIGIGRVYKMSRRARLFSLFLLLLGVINSVEFLTGGIQVNPRRGCSIKGPELRARSFFRRKRQNGTDRKQFGLIRFSATNSVSDRTLQLQPRNPSLLGAPSKHIEPDHPRERMFQAQ